MTKKKKSLKIHTKKYVERKNAVLAAYLYFCNF